MSVPLYASRLIVVVGCWQWLVGNGASTNVNVECGRCGSSDVDKKKENTSVPGPLYARPFVSLWLAVVGNGTSTWNVVGVVVTWIKRKENTSVPLYARPLVSLLLWLAVVGNGTSTWNVEGVVMTRIKRKENTSVPLYARPLVSSLLWLAAGSGWLATALQQCGSDV